MHIRRMKPVSLAASLEDQDFNRRRYCFAHCDILLYLCATLHELPSAFSRHASPLLDARRMDRRHSSIVAHAMVRNLLNVRLRIGTRPRKPIRSYTTYS